MTYTPMWSFSHAGYRIGHAPSSHIAPYVPVTDVLTAIHHTSASPEVTGLKQSPMGHTCYWHIRRDVERKGVATLLRSTSPLMYQSRVC